MGRAESVEQPLESRPVAPPSGMTRAPLLALAVLLLLPALPLLVDAQGADCITLEDFKQSKVGEFPADWKVRKDAGRDVYKVAEEGGILSVNGREVDHHIGEVEEELGLELNGERVSATIGTRSYELEAREIEPGVYLPGWGGVRIEDDVHLVDHGAELLTEFPRDLIELD